MIHLVFLIRVMILLVLVLIWEEEGGVLVEIGVVKVMRVDEEEGATEDPLVSLRATNFLSWLRFMISHNNLLHLLPL